MADHRDFAQRLKQACDQNTSIPPHGKGQQVHIANSMNPKVSQEAVRRWFEGQSKPRPKLMTQLAKVLNVDEAWLSLGTTPEMTLRGKRQYSQKAEASTYMVFGLFMAQGHSCAFSSEKEEAVDFYAIKAGQQKSISVTTGYRNSSGEYVIPVKVTYQDTVNVAVVENENRGFDMLVMDVEGIEQFGVNKGGFVHITATDGDRYTTDGHEWVKLQESSVL